MALTNVTLLENLIDPLVISDMLTAELENALRATKFFKVDRTLTGQPGSTILLPVWKYIGPASDLPENTEGEITQMDYEDQEFTIKKAVKNVALTDESVLSGFGNPVDQAIKQLRMSIADKMDNDAVELLEAIDISSGRVIDRTGNPTFWTDHQEYYFALIEALDMLQDNEEQGGAKYLLINHTTLKRLRKNTFYNDRFTELGDQILQTGVIGMIAGCRVVISNKLTSDRSYVLMPELFTAFLKRDVNIEQERQMLWKRTIIGSDAHYVVAIPEYDKVVCIDHTGSDPT